MFGTREIIRNSCRYIPQSRLNNKVAVVTASTEGIGYAIARRLGLEGAHIAICSRDQKKVCESTKKLTCEGICVSGFVCDVAKPKDRENLYKETICRFGGIDILVSNAGTNFTMGSILKCDEKMWDKIFAVNVKAAFMLVKEIVPEFQKRGGGSVVFVSSIGGLHPLKDLGLYSVTKTALIGLTKALAADLANQKINVNAVAPGIIKTKFSKLLWEEKKSSERYLQQIPLNKFGTPEDIAGVVAYMVSDDGKYLTGETIVAAGGMQSRL